MTVSTTFNKVNFTGDGLSTVFTFPFAVQQGNLASIIVLLTDTSGNITSLSQPSQYTVVLNPPIAPNPTPIGGVVTLASAPASGTIITIRRTMAFTQDTSLANQGDLYQPVLESMDDVQVMLIQQLFELVGRNITVAASDPRPGALPPVAQRANLAMGFDSAGNPIAFSTAPAGVISSAMAPVVAASSISAAVALLGLSGFVPEPVGVIKAWAGASTATPPTGYLLCGGQPVDRGTFGALFGVIGTTFGAGNGSTTFNLPDLRGRVPAGLDNINGITANNLTATTIPNGGGPTALGGYGGAETNTISIAQLPAHTHANTLTDNNHTHPMGTEVGNARGPGPGNMVDTLATGMNTGLPSVAPMSITNASVGGGNPTPNVQPTICLNYIIKF